MPQQPFWRFLKDSNGDTDMNVAGSKETPIEFSQSFVRPSTVERVTVIVRDMAMSVPTGFFSIDELANGLWIVSRDADQKVLQDFGTADRPIRTSAGFGALAGVDVESDSVAIESCFNVRWTLSKTGMPLGMRNGGDFVVSVRDDLTDLIEFTMMIQGLEHVAAA